MNDMKYSEYVDMYPETVIIRKEGVFYTVRGEGALVCHNFFGFKCWKTSDEIDSVSTGFVEANLPEVCNKLSEEAISYIVIVHGEITAGDSFDGNMFSEYAKGDISEIPYREPPKKKNKIDVDVLSDEEKKLCGISIKYMERLLNGRHPVNNSEIEKDSVVMDENVQRCFSFVVDILNRAVHAEKPNETEKAVAGRKKEKKGIPAVATFKPDFEDVIDRMIQDKELRMSELEAFIKPYLGELFVEEIDKIPAARISNWLLDNGYLCLFLVDKC